MRRSLMELMSVARCVPHIARSENDFFLSVENPVSLLISVFHAKVGATQPNDDNSCSILTLKVWSGQHNVMRQFLFDVLKYCFNFR